jgi:Ni/Co efflux regulator RcnB
MKTSAIVCAVLAGTFGLGSIASAQVTWPLSGNDLLRPGAEQQRHQPPQGRDQQRPARVAGEPRWQGGYAPRWAYGNQPRYDDHQQRYAYAEPGDHHRFYRGGYLPREYRGRPYYVNNWNAYPGLYSPPHGYQWMNVDGQFLLVALATGLIANALVNTY